MARNRDGKRCLKRAKDLNGLVTFRRSAVDYK